jgi:hypothetical protein
MEFCDLKHILAGNKAYVGRTISSPQNSRSEYLRQTESARRVHMVPVSNGRHWVWQLRRPQGSWYLNVELQIPTAARIQPVAGQDMLYFRAKICFKSQILKKRATWELSASDLDERFGLNRQLRTHILPRP